MSEFSPGERRLLGDLTAKLLATAVFAVIFLGIAITVAVTSSPDASMTFGLWCIVAGVLGTLSVQKGHALVVARRAIRFSHENASGLEALSRRDFAAARTIFSRLLAETHHPQLRNTVEHNLAWTAFVDGRLGDALASWEHIERRLGRDATYCHHIAVVAGLLGNLGRAGDAIQRVVALGREERITDPPVIDAWVKLAQIIVDLRAGEPKRALIALESSAPLMRSRLSPDVVPAVDCLLAFAHALTDSPRDAGAPRVTLSSEQRDRLRFLHVEWPEMRALLFAERA